MHTHCKTEKKHGHQNPFFNTLLNLADEFAQTNTEAKQPTNHIQPSANIFEKEDVILIELALPGVQKEDVLLSFEKNMLSIAVEKKVDEKKYLRKEFGTAAQKRIFRISDQIDMDKLSAKMEHGILKIELPKKEKAAAKNITIN